MLRYEYSRWRNAPWFLLQMRSMRCENRRSRPQRCMGGRLSGPVTGESVVSDSVMAPQSGSSARRRCAARVGPLASSGNAAIGPESKPDTIDSPVTGHLIVVILELLIARAPERIRNAVAGDHDQAHNLAGITDCASGGLGAHLAFDEHGPPCAADQHFALACFAREVIRYDQLELVVRGPFGGIDHRLAVRRGERHREATLGGPQIAAAQAIQHDAAPFIFFGCTDNVWKVLGPAEEIGVNASGIGNRLLLRREGRLRR